VSRAQLLEQGRYSLDQPVEDLLPEIAETKVLTGFDPAERPILRAPRVKPRMRHLFTHTSGHSSDLWNADTLRYLQAMELPGTPTCKKAAFSLPLVFDPGSAWEYGIATDWLGMTVERLSGMRLEEYFRKCIFDPIGMEWTSFIISPRQRAELVPVRGKRAGGGFDTFDFEIAQTPE
jgi:methyl acetate hydrolase